MISEYVPQTINEKGNETNSFVPKSDSIRLPKSVTPLLYKLKFQPDLEKQIFYGTSTITVKINEPTKVIILNALNLEISRCNFKNHPKSKPILGTVTIDKESERAIIYFHKTLEPSSDGILTMNFKGQLVNSLKGFYQLPGISLRSGVKSIFAVTQFEPAFARKAFPCWDEPAIKAEFELTVIAPKYLTCLSNTSPVWKRPHPIFDYLKIIRFERTPLMSTYLIALIIGEYDRISSITKQGTKVRVFTPTGKTEQGIHAFDVAFKTLEWYEDYFGIPYALEKIDHVPLSDFNGEGMENWGLVTYAETGLLFDSKNSALLDKLHISTLIAHETAHQWFGNLVTMEWWSDLWLKEGFATFIPHRCLQEIYPESEYKNVVVENTVKAMVYDSYHLSHPIEVKVGLTAEIDIIFDAISYQKGCAILEMLYNWLGEKVFQKSLHTFLASHSYSSVTTVDLWKTMESVSNEPVGEVMSTWTKQMGFPIITVTENEDVCGSLVLSQERFTRDGKLSEEEKLSIWSIPISVKTQSYPDKVHKVGLMNGKSMEIEILNHQKCQWYKFNPDFSSFYRVNYPISNWTALGEAIRSKSLSPRDRLQLIDDLTALNLAGKVETKTVADMLKNYSEEDNFVPWTGIQRCLSYFEFLLRNTEARDRFRKFARLILKHNYQRLGWDEKPGESFSDHEIRLSTLSALVNLDDFSVIKMGKQKFDDYLAGQPLPPDLRLTTYRAAIINDKRVFDQLVELYKKTELQTEKLKIAQALGENNLDETMIQKTLEFAMSDFCHHKDVPYIFGRLSSTSLGFTLVWEYYKENYDQIKIKMKGEKALLYLATAILAYFEPVEMISDIENFFDSKKPATPTVMIKQVIENIKATAEWLKREVQSTMKDFWQKI